MTKSNYRDLANRQALLLACKRDKYIERAGIPVNAMLPILNESEDVSEIEFYGDIDSINRQDQVMYLIPQYEEYQQILSILDGDDLEEPLPLECIVKSTDKWPKDTIFRLPVFNNTTGEMEDRYWRVLSETKKHLEVSFERRIKVVPARDHVVEGIN